MGLTNNLLNGKIRLIDSNHDDHEQRTDEEQTNSNEIIKFHHTNDHLVEEQSSPTHDDDESESESECDDCNTNKPTKTVSFGQIKIREFELMLGDHLSCRNGPPVAIDGSNYVQKDPLSIEDYEQIRESQRKTSRRMLKLTAWERRSILSLYGYTPREMTQKEIELAQERRLREKGVSMFCSDDDTYVSSDSDCSGDDEEESDDEEGEEEQTSDSESSCDEEGSDDDVDEEQEENEPSFDFKCQSSNTYGSFYVPSKSVHQDEEEDDEEEDQSDDDDEEDPEEESKENRCDPSSGTSYLSSFKRPLMMMTENNILTQTQQEQPLMKRLRVSN